MENPASIKKGDWIRFQVLANKVVLEGFVQEIAPDESRIKVGKAPDWPESAWYARNEIRLLKQQSR
jgi:hypothetical protein